MAVLSVPDPSLVVLIGAAGSGKSTFAARHFSPSEVLSSDGYRALIAGDEADQGATRAAFGRLHRELERRLAARLLTVVDATNLEPGARRALLLRSGAAGTAAVAIVFDLPEHVVLAQNARRAHRFVDEGVVRNHLARLRAVIDGLAASLYTEGFASVAVLRDPVALEEVTVVRVPE